MFEKMMTDIEEIVKISEKVPEKLREKCFEILLSHYLKAHRSGQPDSDEKPDGNGGRDSNNDSGKAKDQEAGQEDIQEKDVHVKAKRFLQKYSLSMDQINQLFYLEEEEIKPLYDNLGTTVTSECQIRIGLLHALVAALQAGEFDFDGEAVRQEASLRKCYDPTNFTSHFNKNASLFDGFEKYSKNQPRVRLSQQGREKLAELIKELQ